MSIPTILVIEDNFADVSLLRISLDRLKIEYRLEILTDGEKALNHLDERRASSSPLTPCVILLDLHLPKYNGLQILNAIRKDPVLTDTHVMVLTSTASPTEEIEVQSLGALLRLKPSNLDGFYALAEEAIQLCKGSPAPAASLSLS